jgi:hypothetical protein
MYSSRWRLKSLLGDFEDCSEATPIGYYGNKKRLRGVLCERNLKEEEMMAP